VSAAADDLPCGIFSHGLQTRLICVHLRRSASHFFRAVPAGTGFRSPEAEGTQPILIARGGSFAVLSRRWVMWQKTPAARIVNRSSLENCAVQAVDRPARFLSAT